MSNFPQPDAHTTMPAAGNTSNFDIHHIPDSNGNTLFYGMAQYNCFQHHPPAGNTDLGVATASNYHNPYMIPSGNGVLPLPINQGSRDPNHLPSSSYGGVIVVPTDDYIRNNPFMDDAPVSFKRKNAVGIPKNFPYCNASACSSSAVASLHMRPLEPGVTPMDAATFPPAEYRRNDSPLVIELGSHRSVRNRSGAIGPDSMLAHNPNPLIQANYLGQAFQTASPPWLDQQFGSNGGHGSTLTWNQSPALTYLHGSSMTGGCPEPGNMGAQGYQASLTTFRHLHPMHLGQPNVYPPPQPMQRARGQNISFHSQVATPSHRLPTNSTIPTSMNPFQDGIEMGPRYMGPAAPTGLRIYRPHRRALIPQTNLRHHNLPQLRVLPEDGVAMLEMSGYYELGVDHHRDMRLDIDNMTYEELLALGEQIGSVATGLSEETTLSHLKTITYISSTTSLNSEEAVCVDQETIFCVICQTEYKNQEKIGILDCGHVYHVDCVKRWLLVKNTCPICKSSALKTEIKDRHREGL